MKALTVLYHDVVERNFDESGFPGAASERYKVKRDVFNEHLRAMKGALDTHARGARPDAAAIESALGPITNGARALLDPVAAAAAEVGNERVGRAASPRARRARS